MVGREVQIMQWKPPAATCTTPSSLPRGSPTQRATSGGSVDAEALAHVAPKLPSPSDHTCPSAVSTSECT